MRCGCCSKEKLSSEFTTLRTVGEDENGVNLNRYCLRCLQTEVVSEQGKFHQQVESDILAHLQREIDVVDGVKMYKGKYEVEWEKENQNTLTISFLGGDLINMPVNANTRIKDIKVFIGEAQNSDPRQYRILLGDEELKVRLENGNANLLSNYGEVREVNAIRPYGAHAGQSTITAAPRDQFGNAMGSTYDLGVDGAFRGLTVAVLQFYFDDFDFLLPKAALEEKGFTVLHWKAAPNPTELRNALSQACQLWVISTSNQLLTEEHLTIIVEFYRRGKGLYLWGDNQPFFADANAVLTKIYPTDGVRLEGNDPGTKTLVAKTTPNGVGFDSEHFIFTGIENLYEGITIARVIYPERTRMTKIAMSSHGHPVTCILDDGAHRLAIDGGFTRMFPGFWNVTAGTSRFVKNISAWLCGFEGDWVDE